jgi:integrase
VPIAIDPYVLSNDADSSGPWKARAAGKRFQRLCAAAGVTGVRLYDLRHAHATALLEAGVHVNVVAERLGNDPAVTLRVYGRARAGADRAAADATAATIRRLKA